MENENQNQAEVKTNWFKTHKTQCIIGAVVVVAIVAAVVIFMMMNTGNPEKTMEAYLKAMSSGDSEELLKITDLKGAAAWEKCNGKPEKFEEEYNKISDENAKKYEEQLKSVFSSATSLLKSLGTSYTMETESIEKPVELGKNLYRVNAKVKIKMSIFGINQEQEKDESIVVYNGKFIGEYSED